MGHPSERIRANHAQFQRLLSDLTEDVEQAPVESLLKRAQEAAIFAWSNSCGFFASPELEAVLAKLSARLADDRRASDEETPSTGRRRMLMVLSGAYGVGGHSRLATRWIRLFADVEYTIVLTLQDHLAVPEPFLALAAAGTIRLIVLDRPSFSERVIALRRLVSQSDCVVLLIHPHDVIPNAAIAAMAEPPPVLFQDHASHTFWLGATISTLVLSETGTLLGRRGVPPQHVAWVPLPMDFQRFVTPGAIDIRHRYGIPAGVPLLLSCGASFKYRPIEGVSLPELLAPLFATEPSLHLLVVGVGLPDMPISPEWRPLMSQFGGRVKLVGRLDEAVLNACYRDANIYLDSTPFSSPTAMFEAAAGGLPVVRFAPQDWRQCEFSLDMETIPTRHYIWSDEASYREDILRLLHDRAYYEWRCRFGQQAVQLVHSDEAFACGVQAACDRAPSKARIRLAAESGACRVERLDVLLDCLLNNIAEQDRLETDWKVYAVAASDARNGKIEDAVSRLFPLAENRTGHWQVYNELACYALHTGDVPAAVELLRHAVAISAEANDASLNLAGALIVAEEWSDARKVLDAYLEALPNDGQALAMLAQVGDACRKPSWNGQG